MSATASQAIQPGDASSPGAGGPAFAGRRRRREGGVQAWRVIIFVICFLLFLVPILSSIKYALIQKNGKYGFSNFTQIISNPAIRSSVLLSLELAVVTALITAVILLPTAVLVRLKLPKLAILMDGMTLLPFVVPPIVIADGLFALHAGAPLWYANLLFNHTFTLLVPVYVVLAMPLFYRMIDIGLRAIDLHTLVDASRSLGSGWTSTLLRVVLPNIQTAMLGGMFLTLAMVLGELVIANQFSVNTFPVQMIVTANQDNSPGIAVAESLLAFGFTFLLLFLLTFLARRRGSQTAATSRGTS